MGRQLPRILPVPGAPGFDVDVIVNGLIAGPNAQSKQDSQAITAIWLAISHLYRAKAYLSRVRIKTVGVR